MQAAAIFAPERYGLIEASTKAGKTLGCLAWLAERAMNAGEGHNLWWVAPILAQARIAFRRLRRLLPRGSFVVNESELTITLAQSGAVLSFKGADHPDSLYGEDVYAAVIDEASRCKEDAWHAIRSTLTATRGPVRIIGNVKGRRNWAYLLARRAEVGEPDMHYAKITAHDAVTAGVLAADEIEDARRQLPENVFRELYLAEPSDDGGNPFGLVAIAGCVRALSDRAPVVFGIDLAKSQDWTVVIGLDRAGVVCRYDRFQLPWQLTIPRIEAAVGGVFALVDSTGVGDPIVEALQARYGEDRYQGFKFTSQSKQQVMEGLAVAIQGRAVGFPDNEIRAELDEFEYVYTRTGVRYSAPVGLHDDCVSALALAVRAQGQRPALTAVLAQGSARGWSPR